MWLGITSYQSNLICIPITRSRRLLRVLWTARRSNQTILREISPWVFIGRIDFEAETPILWPPDAKIWLIWKDPDAGKDWGQEEKGTTEDEMVGWHHWLKGHGFEWTPGVGDGQGGLACCGSWNRRVGHDWVTELNRINAELCLRSTGNRKGKMEELKCIS